MHPRQLTCGILWLLWMIAPSYGQDAGGNNRNPTAPAAAPIPGLEPIPAQPKPPVEDAPGPESFDEEQKEIVTAATDKIIADILALKSKYPELEHFGEAPWFTRGLGEFRYEYKLERRKSSGGRWRALPGGCGLRFRLAPDELVRLGEFFTYDSIGSFGASMAGISPQYEMIMDVSADGLRKTIFGSDDNPPDPSALIYKDLDSTFYLLAGKYLLKKKGVKTDFPSLLKALESADPDIYYSAFGELRHHTFSAQELQSLPKTPERFNEPLRVMSGVTSLIKDKDNSHLPEAYLRFVRFTLLADKEGIGEHNPPSTWEGWTSGEARKGRWMTSLEILASGEERFAETEALILREDPGADGRRKALDYFAKLSSPRATNEIIGALRNPKRSVQAKAAEILGQKKITDARKELERLLTSPSSNVRKSAIAALVNMGFPPGTSTPARTLSDSAKHIASVLWTNGLDEEEIVRICAQPSKFPVSRLPSDPPPEKSQFPAGVDIEEIHGTDSGGNATRFRNVSLTDPWRMTKLDRESVQRRSLQYVAGFGVDHITSNFTDGLDPTGPFLLAGALKEKDLESAERVYERMCDEFETDEDILDRGLTGLAWEQFQAPLYHYWMKNDAKALSLFERVIHLKRYAKPWSLLEDYVKESAALSAEIERRQREKISPAPPLADKAAYVDYWIGRIKEINGVEDDHGDASSYPVMWYEQLRRMYNGAPSRFLPKPPFATDKLREAGLPALPRLFDALEDKTPTRTVKCGSYFYPVRDASVGDAAREIVQVICDDYGLIRPKFLKRKPDGSFPPLTPALRAELSDWFAKIPPDSEKLSNEAREQFVREQRQNGERVFEPPPQ